MHLFTGIINHLIDVLQKRICDMKKRKILPPNHPTMYEWAHASPRCIVREKYQGGKLNGPNCKKLLSGQILDDLEEFLPRDLKPFALTLKKFRQLVHACFRNETKLDQNWPQYHREFMTLIKSLNIPMWRKLHVIDLHVPEFLNLRNVPLGRYTEVKQSIELKSYHCNYIIKI